MTKNTKLKTNDVLYGQMVPYYYCAQKCTWYVVSVLIPPTLT